MLAELPVKFIDKAGKTPDIEGMTPLESDNS